MTEDDQSFAEIHALPEDERLAVFDAIVEEKRKEQLRELWGAKILAEKARLAKEKS